MPLIEIIKDLDTSLFLAINGLHTSFYDGFMYAVSEKLTWIPLYLSVLFVVVKQWKKEAVWVVLALILCIVISDQVSSGILKNLVQRLRPSHAENLKGLVHLVNGYVGGKYGFASSHAANSFGFALLSSLLFRNKSYSYAIFTWALITVYSRIYLGVHYPLDVFGGICIGSAAALICYWLLRKFRPDSVQQNASIDKSTSKVPISVLGLSFLGIIVYSIII